jgi:hypothetical protein
MQNKPNFRKAKINPTFFYTKGYDNDTAFSLRQNKPNQTQLPYGRNQPKLLSHKGLSKSRPLRTRKNKPKQTQTNPREIWPVVPMID